MTLREYIVDQSTLAAGNTVRDCIDNPAPTGGGEADLLYPIVGTIDIEQQLTGEVHCE